MDHPKLILLSGLLLIIVATLLFRAGVVNAAPGQSCAWHAVSAPNPSGHDQLNAIAATSATDAWIVGYYYNCSNDVQTLIEHWNSTSWSVVPSPNPTEYDKLSGVAVVPGSNQVWAEGIHVATNGNYQTLTELYC